MILEQNMRKGEKIMLSDQVGWVMSKVMELEKVCKRGRGKGIDALTEQAKK